MIPELGHLSLILALCMALVMSFFPLVGAWRGDRQWMSLARPAAWGQFAFLVFAFACLAWAFLHDDFSVAYVASNSNSALPWYYKFSAVWGAHEGSLLLWALILGGWTFAVSIFSRELPEPMLARVLAVMGMISTGFLLFLIITSNPFNRLLPNMPADGNDLNPLLQDFGLIVHPPMLYMGYVGFSVAFAFAIAALLGGRLDAAWARWSRPWTIIAWAFLSVGIVLGSWWAYYELGWGGWWFWDPVENASFMPWLVGTALIHSLAVTEKRGALRSWTVLLAIVILRYNHRRNPDAAGFTHNTKIEIAWTLVPVLILVLIGSFSLPGNSSSSVSKPRRAGVRGRSSRFCPVDSWIWKKGMPAISRPPSACGPSSRPTTIGTATGSSDGMIISRIAERVSMSTARSYCGLAVPCMIPGISRNWRRTSSPTAPAERPTASIAIAPNR